jgi:hypothetical protein
MVPPAMTRRRWSRDWTAAFCSSLGIRRAKLMRHQKAFREPLAWTGRVMFPHAPNRPPPKSARRHPEFTSRPQGMSEGMSDTGYFL